MTEASSKKPKISSKGIEIGKYFLSSSLKKFPSTCLLQSVYFPLSKTWFFKETFENPVFTTENFNDSSILEKEVENINPYISQNHNKESFDGDPLRS